MRVRVELLKDGKKAGKAKDRALRNGRGEREGRKESLFFFQGKLVNFVSLQQIYIC